MRSLSKTDVQRSRSKMALEKDKEERKRKQRDGKLYCITRSMADDRGRKEILRTTVIESLIYIIFLVTVTFYVFGVHSTDRFLLNTALEQQFLGTSFTTTNDVGISFDDIKTVSDFWAYINGPMLGSIHWKHTYKDNKTSPEDLGNTMKILNENQVLGVPRMRQVKVRNDSCIVHEYFRQLFLSCYASYSEAAQDTDPFGPQTSQAWFFADESKTLSESYTGHIASYDGSGYYLDFTSDYNTTKQLVSDLEENLWITRGTRAVFIDFSIYNANLDMFSICKLVFEFPITGGVIASHKFHLIDLIRYGELYDYIFLGMEAIFYSIVVFYIAMSIREIVYFKLRYFILFWSYIDWTVIICSIFSANISVRNLITGPKILQVIQENSDQYGNMESLGKIQESHDNFLAMTLFFTYIKAFKYLKLSRSMGELNDTLSKCASDIAGFSIMFIVIFFAFAELGYLIFGTQVKHFSHFTAAILTLFRSILGDFDYQEIQEANRYIAPVYFITYNFFVLFVLMNMFLAIITDTYKEVKIETMIAPEEKMNMSGYLWITFKECLKKLPCFKDSKMLEFQDDQVELNLELKQIQEALQTCGFSEYEVEMFFARYNININEDAKLEDIQKLQDDLANLIAGDEKTKSSETYVKLDDFIKQQERLEQVDTAIRKLGEQLKMLLLKFDNVEYVKKTKK